MNDAKMSSIMQYVFICDLICYMDLLVCAFQYFGPHGTIKLFTLMPSSKYRSTLHMYIWNRTSNLHHTTCSKRIMILTQLTEYQSENDSVIPACFTFGILGESSISHQVLTLARILRGLFLMYQWANNNPAFTYRLRNYWQFQTIVDKLGNIYFRLWTEGIESLMRVHNPSNKCPLDVRSNLSAINLQFKGCVPLI